MPGRSLPTDVPISAAFVTLARARAARLPWEPRRGGALSPAEVDVLLEIPDDDRALEEAYLAILRRAPDPAGMAAHRAAIAAGATRLERIIGLANSGEGRRQPGADTTLAVLRATQAATFLGQLGSELERRHLLAERELEDLWTALWVDAVREVLPFTLRAPNDITRFRAAIRAGDNPLPACLAAWRAATSRLSWPARTMGRIRMRLTWRSTYARIQGRLHLLASACTALGILVNEPLPVTHE